MSEFVRPHGEKALPILLALSASLVFSVPASSLTAADAPDDPLADVYAKEIPSAVESLIAQFRRERKYKVSDFPLKPEKVSPVSKRSCLGMDNSPGT